MGRLPDKESFEELYALLWKDDSIPGGRVNGMQFHGFSFMPALEQSELADLVSETRHRLELSQVKFAAKVGVSFQSINRWENGRAKPLPVALKQIELHQMGDSGKELLAKYFAG